MINRNDIRIGQNVFYYEDRKGFLIRAMVTDTTGMYFIMKS